MRAILDSINKSGEEKKFTEMLENHIANISAPKALAGTEAVAEVPLDDRSKEEVKEDDTDLYNISNFSI